MVRRFAQAGDYEAGREWRRYEGTPQRDLLREVRRRFLERALRRLSAPAGLIVEVGPGPGRFTPPLAAQAGRLVLVDVSPRMLAIAEEHATSVARRPVDLVLGDAAQLPIHGESADAVVALGNIVGSAGDRSLAALQEIAGVVAPGGILVLETVAPPGGRPVFLRRTSPKEWKGLLSDEPERALSPLLAEGFDPAPPSSPGDRGPDGFRHFQAAETARFLDREGFDVVEQALAAPLVGGEPELVAAILRGGAGALRRLVHWEELAGRHPAVLRAGGGPVLTCAVSR